MLPTGTLLSSETLDELISSKKVRSYQEFPFQKTGTVLQDLLEFMSQTNPLSRTERGILEHHTLAGFVLLAFYQKDCQDFAAKVARDHHERRDGSGYPLGVTSVDPMVEIIAASDIYDALISPRPYRPLCYDNRTAWEKLMDMAGQGKIGMAVVQALVAHNRKTKPHPKECKVSTGKRGTPLQENLYGVFADSGPLHDEP